MLLGGGTRQPLLAQPAPIVAQGYDELPVEESLKRQVSAVHLILSDGKFAGDTTAFDNYYNNYFLARWTQPKNVAALPDLRKFLRFDLRAAKPGEVHDHLNQLALEFMTRLMVGRYHPAVRVNAALMIGELNSVEPVVGTAAVPLPNALKVLLGTVESPKASDALRAAAMVGIMRHAEAGIPDEDTRYAMTSAMLRIVGDEAATGAAAPGREWIREQAVDTLGLLGSVGENDAVFYTLVKVVGDTKLPLSVRTSAAEALGRLDYAAAGKVDAAEAVAALGQFAIDACNDELRRPSVSGMNMRRHLLHRLDAVRAALSGSGESRKGLLPLARENQAAFVTGLQKNVTEVAELLDDRRHDNDDVKTQAETLRKKIEAWLKTKPA